MTEIVVFVGDLGSGKTTIVKLINAIVKQERPDIPTVANIDLGSSARKVEDTNKFIAIKLIKEDKKYAMVTTDEAAQAGLESRGSGSKSQALETRVITLARKAHVDDLIVSQLMSMIDKRAQWLANEYVLCEAKFDSDNFTIAPDYFEYTVYDSNLKEINGFTLEAADCAKYLWPDMDTDDIPFAQALKAQWIHYYDIAPADEAEFIDIMEGPAQKGV